MQRDDEVVGHLMKSKLIGPFCKNNFLFFASRYEKQLHYGRKAVNHRDRVLYTGAIHSTLQGTPKIY